MKAIFLPVCFPPISYFGLISRCQQVVWDVSGYYEKQTYRNRTKILSANGVLSLSVPVQKSKKDKQIMRDVRIFHLDPWRKKHWKSLESAYRTSPYFEHYEEGIRPIFEKKHEYLLDYQKESFSWCLRVLGLSFEWLFTESYQEVLSDGLIDARNSFDPKKPTADLKEYIQVFSNKFDFASDLSILDLLFCQGPAAKDYLFNSVL